MKSLNTWFLTILFFVLGVYFIGAAVIDVMEIDSAHYAEMAREMHETGRYLELKNRLADDYLDKPPLIFWLSSLMFSTFGVSVFSFRMPAILASILGAYSLFRFTRMYYSPEQGASAAFMLLTSQAFFLYNQNYLTDTLLVNFTIFSIWQLSAYLEKRRWTFFLGAFTGLGLAMLSKGPLGLMVPALGFFLHFLYRKEWKNIFRWEWLAGAVLILAVLSPMLIGLFRQFGSTGLQFYFWTQSFGRLTGQSHWHDQSSSLYFTHTMVWFLLPWSVLFLYGLIRNIYSLLDRKSRWKIPEMITTGGFVLSFVALSLSRYKLPQYVLVLMPFAMVLASRALFDITHSPGLVRWRRFFYITQLFIGSIYLLLGFGIIGIIAPAKSPIPYLIPVAGTILMVLLYFRSPSAHSRMVLPVSVAVITTNLLLAMYFYPMIMHYQPGRQMANEFRSINSRDKIPLFSFRYHSPALDFHLGSAPPVINERKLGRLIEKNGTVWIVTSEDGLNYLGGYRTSKKIEFAQYPVQALSLKFLHPETRKSVTGKAYLIELTQ